MAYSPDERCLRMFFLFLLSLVTEVDKGILQGIQMTREPSHLLIAHRSFAKYASQTL